MLAHRSGGSRPVAGDSKPNAAMRGTHQSTNLEQPNSRCADFHRADLRSFSVRFAEQWDEEIRESALDFARWQRFLGRILELDATGQLGNALVEHRNLMMSILDDEYLSRFFWEKPSDVRARKSKKAKYDAQTWYLETRWVMILDRQVERIYLMWCQLIHGAATFGGKLNRESLGRCSVILGHLLHGILLAVIDHGADENWGAMCYPPLR